MNFMIVFINMKSIKILNVNEKSFDTHRITFNNRCCPMKDYTDLFRNKVIAGAIYPMYKGCYKLK